MRTGSRSTQSRILPLTSFFALCALTLWSSGAFAATAPPSISKSFSAATAPLNTSATLTFTITNPNGATDLTGVSFNDNLPAGLIIANPDSLTGTCDPGVITPGVTSINLVGGTILANSSCTFSIDVLAISPGTQVNTTDPVTSNEGGTGNTATASIDVPSPDLTIAKTHAGNFSQGQTGAAYTLTVTNVGGATTAATATVVDTLPPGLMATSISGIGWLCNLGTLTCSRGDGLDAGLSYPDITLTVNVALSAAALVTNTATVAGGAELNTANDTATDPTTVNPAIDLAVTKNGPATFAPGANLTYTVSLTNNGVNPAVTAALNDTTPPGTTFVSTAAPAGFNCTNPAVGGTGTINCTNPSLAAGATAIFTIVLHTPSNLTSGTTITNTATVSAETLDINPVNNTATTTATATTQADLGVTKNLSGAINPGSNFTYTIVVTNNGPSDAQNVSMVDPLPAGTTFVSEAQSTGPAFNCITPAVGVTGTITCTIPTLVGAAGATFSIVLHAPSNLAGGTTISNTTTVSTSTTDPNSANNSATATATATQLADLAIGKVGPASANAGSNVTWTIVVVNNGPSDAASVSMTDPLPAGTTFVSESQTAGPTFGCTTPAVGAAGTVTCMIAALPTGASATFSVVMTMANASTPNVATVSSSATDPNPANNTATATVGVNSADVSIVKSVSAPLPYGGQNLTYTLVVANAGPGTATGVTVTDTLPAGSTFQSATPAGVCSGTTTLTCSVGTLLNGASTTITLVVTAPTAGGTVTNTATVSTASPDPNPANNSSTATVGPLGPASGIPAFSEWALFLLAAMIGLLALRKIS